MPFQVSKFENVVKAHLVDVTVYHALTLV